MLQFEELRLKLEGLLPDIADLAHAIGLEQMKSEVAQLELRAAEPGFWDNMENAQKVTQRTSNLKDRIDDYHRLETNCHDTLTLIDLAD
ncbi:MAG: peptide chain release factor 2, partial [Clostridia bacterium]|nr:peptide chain release factor 2 [Clostridia bacterium]